jgi:hypothetical protein
MKKQPQEPKVVAKYKEYEITQGINNKIFYGFHKKEFIGQGVLMSEVVNTISLLEGEGFDINKVKVL